MTLDLKAIREEAEHAAIRSDPAGRLSAHVSALVDEVERLRTKLSHERQEQDADEAAWEVERATLTTEVERLRADLMTAHADRLVLLRCVLNGDHRSLAVQRILDAEAAKSP